MSQGAVPSTAVSSATYTVDPAHSTVDFRVRHLMIANIRGEFSGVAGTVVFDPRNPANSQIEAEIDTATINTRDSKRDEHLKAAEFLDVQKYPKIKFVSKEIEPAGKDHWKVEGDLTIHGITRNVTFDAEGPTPEAKDPWGNIKIGATLTGKFNRADFGLIWNVPLESGGVLISDEVTIHLDIELTKQQPA